MGLTWPPTGTELAFGLAAFLLVWYVVGLHLGRRRGVQLVRQVRDSVLALGGSATIQWIGRSAFRIEVTQLTGSFSALGVHVLLEPRETFLLWLVGRLGGRRDWLVLSAVLSGPAGPGFQVYHPRRRGAADAVHRIRAEGWKTETVRGRPSLLAAARDADGRALAEELLGLLRGVEIWGLSLHPAEHRLTVSVPVPATQTTLPVFPVFAELADTIVRRRRF
jgi:hypothetical protein